MEFTNNAKSIRKAKGFTLQYVADRLGASRQYISQLEKGDGLTLNALAKLCRVLDCMPNDILLDPTERKTVSVKYSYHIHLINGEGTMLDANGSVEGGVESGIDDQETNVYERLLGDVVDHFVNVTMEKGFIGEPQELSVSIRDVEFS